MKRVIYAFFYILCISCFFLSCGKEKIIEIQVTEISFNQSDITMKAGTEAKIVASISPSDATNKEIIWRSDDYSVATIVDGLIKAKEPGTTVITATTSNGLTARCNVTVVIPVESVDFKNDVIDIGVGEARSIEVIIKPDNASNQAIKWDSSDESIVTVDDNGTIIGKRIGNASITVSSEDDYFAHGISSTIEVFVNEVVNGHYYVDLGLSVKWAVVNLGAESRADYGDRFAWGVVKPDYDYTWVSYPKEYIDSKYYRHGFDYTYQVLKEEDDAVCSLWGNGWRMPTDAEFLELKNNCSFSWGNYRNTYGAIITSNVEGYKDNYIFLPAGGCGNIYNTSNNSIEGENETGHYWTSVFGGDNVGMRALFGKNGFISKSGQSGIGYDDQCDGMLIRGVIK